MKPVVEFIGFLGLSVAAHLAFWQGASGGAPGTAGAGGEAIVTLIGGTPVLQEMVAQWDRPPDTAVPVTPAAMRAPDTDAPLPAVSRQDDRPSPLPPAAAPPVSGGVPVLPEIDLSVPSAPLSRLAPETSPRPKSRRVAVPREQPRESKPKAAAKPAQTPAPPALTAAGTGGQTVSGQSANSGAATQASGSDAGLISRWGGAIRARVERRKQYPGGATGQGRTQLWLRVSAAGKLQDVGIVQSSGNSAFDSAALHTVRRAALPRAPKGIEAGIYRFTLSISFTR